MSKQTACTDEPEPKFIFGQIVSTPNAFTRIPNDEILLALLRHLEGDWGALDRADWTANEKALEKGGRLFSEYFSKQQVKFWIITEADRSRTTVLLPEDY
ncbi:MAG: hypothetical protein MN733_06125 [Nitrososphaera sp.]|nr:hypothetical protein [Nitrososphaera sp.]